MEPWRSRISDRNYLAIYLSAVPRCFLSSFESIGFSVEEKKRRIDFQDSGNGCRVGFSIGRILAISNLQVTPMLPTKFRVNWPSGPGGEAQNRFSRWRPSWNFDRNELASFKDLQITPILPTKVRVK